MNEPKMGVAVQGLITSHLSELIACLRHGLDNRGSTVLMNILT